MHPSPSEAAVRAPSAATAAAESSLYRRVWRWHFYAGLVCLPFLALMAITGALYLYKDALESLLYARLQTVAPSASTPLDAETLVERARAAVPGEPVRFVPPAQPDRSAEVGLRIADGTVTVFVDPGDGRVLGQLRDEWRLTEITKRIHSLAIAGPVANHWIEVVAGWAIVLVVSGVFLWWPRGRRGGVYSVRGRPAQRTWWRDFHAVVGVTASVAIVFLAVTGMPWSAFWGQQFGRLANTWGLGLPAYVWGKPQSSEPLASVGDVPWPLRQAPMPHSDPHAGHGHEPPSTPETMPATAAPSMGLNEALRRFEQQRVAAGTPVTLPSGPRGVYTAVSFPGDVRAERVVHLDRYSGAVLADVGYADYGAIGRATSWGVSLHTGRQFGWINQLVMLAACLSIVALAVSAVAMWWKRRPRGRLAAPPRRAGDRAARGAVGVAVVLGMLYPLLGASMLVALLVDALVPARCHAPFGL